MPGYNTENNKTVLVTVTNNHGPELVDAAAIDFSRAVHFGEQLSYDLPLAASFFDADGFDRLAFSVTVYNPVIDAFEAIAVNERTKDWLSLNDNLQRLSGNTSLAALGNYSLSVLAEDGWDKSRRVNFTLTIYNNDPAFEGAAYDSLFRNVSLHAGSSWELAVPPAACRDSDGDQIHYQVWVYDEDNGGGSPAWVQLSSTTPSFDWLQYNETQQLLQGTPNSALYVNLTYQLAVVCLDGVRAAALTSSPPGISYEALQNFSLASQAELLAGSKQFSLTVVNTPPQFVWDNVTSA